MPWDAKAVQPPPETRKDKGRFFPGDIRESPSNAWKISHLIPSDKLTSVVLNYCMILVIAQYETDTA